MCGLSEAELKGILTSQATPLLVLERDLAHEEEGSQAHAYS